MKYQTTLNLFLKFERIFFVDMLNFSPLLKMRKRDEPNVVLLTLTLSQTCVTSLYFITRTILLVYNEKCKHSTNQ